MKKKLLLIALMFNLCLCCCAQKADTVKLVTAFGKPDGKEVSSEMNKDGGMLVSGDGKLELLIPPGALAKKTTISIQAVTNTMQPGDGKAYHLLPSGITFRQPVQLVIHYATKEQEENDPELYGIAMQDEKGQWYDQADAVVDTVSQTITARIHHFSYWVSYDKARLFPLGDRVKVNKKILVYFQYLYADRDKASEAALSVIKVPVLPEWSVNGIKNGNKEVGDIVPDESNFNATKASYYAPSSLPHRNPVQITAKLKNLNYKIGKKTFRDLQVSCSVLVYDNAYEIKMESVIISGGKGVWGGIRTTTDEGSFNLSFDKQDPKILNIQNRLEVMKDDCRNVLLNPTTCTGLLHVEGAKEIKVTPANPPGQPYPIVEIWFVPFPVEFSRVKFDCPHPTQRGKNSSGVHPLMRLGKAFPFYLKFVAKDEKQIITDSSGDDGSLKIWVQKVKDD